MPREESCTALLGRGSETLMLFVMRPHPKDFHEVLLFEHLIDEPMLDVDAARIGSLEIADQLLIGRWIFEGIHAHRG